MSDIVTQGGGEELRPKQKKAILALISSRSVREAAESANLSERTLYRWMSEPAFRAALDQAVSDEIDQATRRLATLANAAIDVMDLALDLDNEESVSWNRLKAAQSVLDYLLKLRESRNVEQRLAMIESQIFGA